MYDYETRSDDDLSLISSSQYSHNPAFALKGEQYLSNADIPWVPWLTAFKKDFLLYNNIKFADGVRFEDTDYMLKSILLAESVIYKPIIVVCHTINPYSTVHFGKDIKKISERCMTINRIYDIVTLYADKYPEGTKAIKGHYNYCQNAILKTTLWRLNYRDILSILGKYPYQGDITTGLIGLTSRHPKLYALISQVFRPLIIAGIKLRNIIRKL